jgi:hypothetical protein
MLLHLFTQTVFKSSALITCKLSQISLLAVLALANQTASAQDLSEDRWVLQASPFTQHYQPSPEHKHVYLLGIERYKANSKFWGGDHSLWGVNYFSNSFGQPSGYLYYGGVYNNLFGSSNWYFKWTGGIIYGYKPPYQNKVPFNRNGWSPGLIAGVGYRITPQLSAQVNALGNSAVMLSFGYELR